MTRIDREVCRDYTQSSRLEWVQPNGTGAFAMGTVSGANTRRYHGLLVASLRPPAERLVLLSKVDETVIVSGEELELSTNAYPGLLHPRGFESLEEFRLDPLPHWTHLALGVRISKRVYLVPGKQTVVIQYRVDRPCSLQVRPLLAFRDYHSLTHANGNCNLRIAEGSMRISLRPYSHLPAICLHHNGARFEGDAKWYFNFEYQEEIERGLDSREDLFTPGTFRFEMRPGDSTWFAATIEQETTLDLSEPVREKNLPVVAHAAAADSFRVRRVSGQPTIVAGYPWFTDWGRDTMISLDGLLIRRGLLSDAWRIIEGFLEHLDHGLIPNRFPDEGETPEYNTVDATLWMFQAVHAYLRAGGDAAAVRDSFYPRIREIVGFHEAGTFFGIHVDPADGLLIAGDPGTQLTWMDAKVDGVVVTPRHGKPVEINALWYNALRMAANWAKLFGDAASAIEYGEKADRVAKVFRSAFWNADRNCLYDVLQEQPVTTLRPNQIFAVSLPFPLLSTADRQSVVNIVQLELLTPYGLRTLERGDPNYHGRYEGDPRARDNAYHQGPVWPWLLGHFIDAYWNAFGRTAETIAYAARLLQPLERDMEERGCLGSLSEIYDGDAPHRPRGCPAQAWSVAEYLRIRDELAREIPPY